jgi:hypothetical protein
MPRRNSLTPALHQAIVAAVAGGVPYYQACLLAGVKVTTATEWLERGESRHPTRPCTPHLASFASDIARAKAQDEARRILRINQAGQGGTVLHEKVTTFADGRQVVERHYSAPDWRADAFHLQHAYADRWGWKARLAIDLTTQVRQMAEEVAQEVGVSADDIIREAQAYLREHDARRR